MIAQTDRFGGAHRGFARVPEMPRTRIARRERLIEPALFPWVRGNVTLLIGPHRSRRKMGMSLAQGEQMLAAFIRALETDGGGDSEELLVRGVWFTRDEIEDGISALIAETVRGAAGPDAAFAGDV